MILSVTRRQMDFIRSTAFETLFGGAAGGGKSYAQLIDALIFAMKYAGSKQLILRRTFPELKRSLIQTSLAVYPTQIAVYGETNHKWTFRNGSVIEFGSCDSENDVTKYQSAEYDVLRFDELTHFTEFQFRYLISRVRGVNGFPKQVKSSTNPGGIGHSWVKSRYIDALVPDEECDGKLFIPARVQDNTFLMKNDPEYIKRLKLLDGRSQKALLYGEWDLFEGQYFGEFSRELHVAEPPQPIPSYWKKYLAIDYGLDMLAALWIALAPDGTAWVYREIYQSGLIISEAAEAICRAEAGEHISQRFAPPDLFNRRQETGRSAVDIFADAGLFFDKAAGERVSGWYAVKEYLHPFTDAMGIRTAKLKISPLCKNLIRTLPAIQTDAANPNDTANTPHELTHAPDALRYFAASVRTDGELWTPDTQEMDAFLSYGHALEGGHQWNI